MSADSFVMIILFFCKTKMLRAFAGALCFSDTMQTCSSSVLPCAKAALSCGKRSASFEYSVQHQPQIKQNHPQQSSVAPWTREDAVKPVEPALGKVRRRFSVVAGDDIEGSSDTDEYGVFK